MAVTATLHCLSGCAIGEIIGLIVGTAFGLSNGVTVVVSTLLAFVFGYLLTSIPLLKLGLGLGVVAGLAFASDTISIATMEVADNVTMVVIPGAMNAGLVNPLFWIALPISLAIGFVLAVPVNKWLLMKGKGHAVVHEYHMKQHEGHQHA